MSERKFYEFRPVLPLAKGRVIVDAALKAARERQLMPLTVVVLDAGGHIITLDREDRSGILRVDIALGKAWGAIGMGFSSRAIGERLQGKDAFKTALSCASDGRFIPVPGGVLVLDDEEYVIGAVGISGDNSDNDEWSAIQGIKAAGYKSSPGA